MSETRGLRAHRRDRSSKCDQGTTDRSRFSHRLLADNIVRRRHLGSYDIKRRQIRTRQPDRTHGRRTYRDRRRRASPPPPGRPSTRQARAQVPAGECGSVAMTVTVFSAKPRARVAPRRPRRREFLAGLGARRPRNRPYGIAVADDRRSRRSRIRGARTRGHYRRICLWAPVARRDDGRGRDRGDGGGGGGSIDDGAREAGPLTGWPPSPLALPVAPRGSPRPPPSPPRARRATGRTSASPRPAALCVWRKARKRRPWSRRRTRRENRRRHRAPRESQSISFVPRVTPRAYPRSQHAAPWTP